MTWLTGKLRPEAGYQPRHRSTRQAADGGQLDYYWHDDSQEPEDAWAQDPSWPQASDRAEDLEAPEFLDQLTVGEIRRILEGCALDDPARVVPDLVGLIAHESHTPDTLAQAWNEFEEATRDVFAIQIRMRDWATFFSRNKPGPLPEADAVQVMRRHADDAWQQITCG